ncbi:UNVERIFIED_CONTAM: hypothetical protein FKN15_058013, partial [Acipenser sinensis]
VQKYGLSLQAKVDVLKTVDNAPSYKRKKDVGSDFNVPMNTLSTILKNWGTIIQAYEQHTVDSRRWRVRFAQYPDVEDTLLLWFKNACDQNGTCKFSLKCTVLLKLLEI